ncbi:MAG: hypothetical protein JSW28_06165 [Thermoplasmata archaeon]|nr:MAG: hypothetical protein JSW28_06165 [Thermoplasmata archaeon]
MRRILITGAVLLFVVLAGCNGPISDWHWVGYFYELRLYPENQTVQFQVIVPLPVNEQDEVLPEFLTSVRNTEGNFTYGTNESVQGPSINIMGTGDAGFDMFFEQESDEPIEGFQLLSMLDEFFDQDLAFFWVYCDTDNISIRLTYEYSESGPEFWTDRTYEMISTLPTGWQRVPVAVEENVW